MNSDATTRGTENTPMRFRFGTLMGLMVAASILLLTAVTSYLSYHLETAIGEADAERQFVQIADRSALRLYQLDSRGSQISIALAQNPDAVQGLGGSGLHPFIPDATRLMHSGDGIFSVFTGFQNGDYIEVSNLEAEGGIRPAWGALPEDRWLVVTVRDTDQGRTETRQFLNSKLEVRTSSHRDTDYRAHERPWFQAAVPGQTTSTKPYELELYPSRGISHVTGTANGRVTGAIVLLSSVEQLLVNQQYPDNHYSAVISNSGEVIASSIKGEYPRSSNSTINDDPRFRELLKHSGSTSTTGQSVTINVGGESLYAYLHEIGDNDGRYVALLVPEWEVLAPSRHQALSNAGFSVLAGLLIFVPVIFASRNLRRPIEALAVMTKRIRERDYDGVHIVDSRIAEVYWLSSSLTGMAESIRLYEARQKELHDSLIQLLATAIDEKSPYTGGHCERVPQLGIALAKAAGEADTPALRDFQLKSEEEQREFEIAAWLHDCGKITTPEHIVDKGSKLEALYNRIHEIRMRFEVLLRDAEIDFWQSLCRDPDNKKALETALAQRQQKITDDFYFVAECNIGGEFMTDEKIQRLEQIGEQNWERRLDDRVGLSPVEEAHMSQFPNHTPALEAVLSDKAEHRFTDERATSRYAGFNFTMAPPEHKQNLGELYNLSIRRGTLTNEDRYLINEHITSTIKMLETLPWTEDLARVPEYAGGHHEKMDGTGYPRSLGAEELSIPARILAVADIFEALTAHDRPYKKAKPLSQALHIMGDMARTGHIDPDLFRLLIVSGIYADYARRYLKAEQIDTVNEEALTADLPSQ